jgi:lactoylglutathione lyase
MELIAQFSHIGVCVTDMPVSLRFYCEGLGFRPAAALSLEGEHTAQLVGYDGDIKGKSQFIRLGDLSLELVQYERPTVELSIRPRPMWKTGFTHLSFHVADVDSVANRLRQLGGTVLHDSRVTMPAPAIINEEKKAETELDAQLVFCLDPDGNRVELMTLPASFKLS